MSRRVAVVCGGPSPESAVSRDSGTQVTRALAERGHDCVLIESDDHLWDRLRDEGFDVVFLALHGRHGEDGTVQGVCELLGLPHTGSGVLASALCFDKVAAKRVMAAEGVATPPWRVVPRGLAAPAEAAETHAAGAAAGSAGCAREAMSAAAEELGLPLVVKPVRGGSTIGLTVVREPGQLLDAYRSATGDSDALCERFISGREITVGILGHNPPRALPTLEIVSHRPLYDYAAKYTPGQSEHIIPARLPAARAEAAQRAALAAHLALGCADISRVDIIVDEEGTPWALEVNSIPGLTELSLLPDAARAAGIVFASLCEQLVESALDRSGSTLA